MPLRDDLLTPIPGENPSGANLRYDPVYDKIKEARRVEDDAPQGAWQRERKVADYKAVIKLAGETLATRTKDLQLGAWLTEALLFQEGFSGLQQGLDLLRGLVEGFWDTIYPEAEDGDLELRAAPVEWVGTRLDDSLRKVPITRGGLNFYKYKESRSVGYEEDAAQSDQKRVAREAAVAEGKVTADDFDKDAAGTPTARYEGWVEALDGCGESLESLAALCEERYRDIRAQLFASAGGGGGSSPHCQHDSAEASGPKGLSTRAGAGARGREAPASDSWATPAAAAAPVRKRVTTGLDPVDLEDVAARLDAVGRFLRQQDPYSPGPYLMLRGYRWGELRGYGEYPDQALLLPPSSETRQSIRKLALEGNWAGLLEIRRSRHGSALRKGVDGFAALCGPGGGGSGYAAVAEAIRSEVRALLNDFPRLPTWTMMDDTPTANAETLAWLKEIAPPPAAAASAEAPRGDACRDAND